MDDSHPETLCSCSLGSASGPHRLGASIRPVTLCFVIHLSVSIDSCPVTSGLLAPAHVPLEGPPPIKDSKEIFRRLCVCLPSSSHPSGVSGVGHHRDVRGTHLLVQTVRKDSFPRAAPCHPLFQSLPPSRQFCLVLPKYMVRLSEPEI